MYDGAKHMLLERLPMLSTDALLRLLDASFAYIEVKDLQEIPLKVPFECRVAAVMVCGSCDVLWSMQNLSVTNTSPSHVIV